MQYLSSTLNTLKNIHKNKTLWVIIGLILFRSVLYEPFIIPSGSMKSTLLVGDYIVTSKYAYGYSRYSFPFAPSFIKGNPRIFYDSPKRGDIVVFRNPHKASTNYIKRVIGLPGDRIQLINGDTYINGEPLKREEGPIFVDSDSSEIRSFIETLDNKRSYSILQETAEGPTNNTGVYYVPRNHFFVMGDNRDNSTDSRFLSAVGFIPAEYLVGRAERVLLSFGRSKSNLIPFRLRIERSWKSLRPLES
ncbi:signal peptidase I [Neorickettsia helminthoeca str. Oregon]|uniref:Signal peptidase I n=1 Tax=Neorickettsia helminthoeca str. Oregon TaxID=1286528 RepID=X5H4P0_9RICK|nr:signal peptidase I [Neorickettsia helminthoeca]AHX11673.1 signal peptidase I [Neorickettsia helminthoeca str. Oregon]